MERPSYAGVQVEVLEHTGGRLQVRYEGEIIPSRPAPCALPKALWLPLRKSAASSNAWATIA